MAETSAAAKRQDKRESLFLSATVTLDSGRSYVTRVRNLSPGGMMIETQGDIAIGSPLAIALRGVGAVTGRVAWSLSGRAGVAFDCDVDPRLARSAPPKSVVSIFAPPQDRSRRPGLAVR